MIATNRAEYLSFTYQEMYLARHKILSREHLVLFIKMLAKRHNIKADKIIFNHDFNDDKDTKGYINNFSINGSYDYIKEELKSCCLNDKTISRLNKEARLK